MTVRLKSFGEIGRVIRFNSLSSMSDKDLLDRIDFYKYTIENCGDNNLSRGYLSDARPYVIEARRRNLYFSWKLNFA